MVRITIDDELKQKLLAAGDSIELCDASGKVLARLAPPAQANSAPPPPTSLPPGMGLEEFEQLRDSNDWGGMTTAEVKELLRNRS